MTVGTPNFIKLVRIYDAPREQVFAAWTDSAQVARWCAPRGFHVTDQAVGGEPGKGWRLAMQKTGGGEYRSSGVYKEAVKPERLVYTHSWEDENDERSPETTVHIEFEDRGGQTLLTFRQDGFPSEESRDGHEEGWCTCLEKLAEHLASK